MFSTAFNTEEEERNGANGSGYSRDSINSNERSLLLLPSSAVDSTDCGAVLDGRGKGEKTYAINSFQIDSVRGGGRGKEKH